MIPPRQALMTSLVAITVLLLPTVATAHCPPKPAARKVVPHVPARKVVACNCAHVSAPKAHHVIHHAPPAKLPQAPLPIAHAPYVDTQMSDADDGSSAVVDLNTTGWESATYTSRIISRRVVTYQTGHRVAAVQRVCRCRHNCGPY